MLPLAEKSPVVLLRWADKARKSDIIPMVKKELEKGSIIIVPNPATNTLLLTSSQQALEEQAEREHLVMERKISAEELIMDHFSKDNREQFRKSSPSLDVHGLFSVHERCHLVLGILERISISDPRLLEKLEEKKHKASTTSLRYVLQSHEWIDILTPLHVDDQKELVRKLTWYPIWRVMPPIDKIQQYYGPEIALYFAWMGFLGQWLGMLGILGLCSFMFRLWREDTIDEDEYTPFYGLFCFLWAVLCFRFWERKENEIAYKWGTLEITNMVDDFEQDYSLEGAGTRHRRPEFKGHMRTSPVTGLPELYFPRHRRKLRYLVSTVVTALMLGVAFFVMILSLNLQGYIRPRDRYHPFYYPRLAVLSEDGAVFDAKSDWHCFIPVVIHAICILTLNTIYRGISKKLTDWENHESRTAYGNSLILKRFSFEAFDCYIVLFYLAFYERDVDRLRMELVAVFNIDSFRRIFVEVIVPILLHYRDEKDNENPHDLHLDEYESFDDYMEILIQFGYVTLFASAYPLASLMMFGAIWIEIRADIYKLTYLCQKPAGARVSDIGMWKSLLKFMVWFCCLTNCLLFGFTSDQMMHYMPSLYIRDSGGETHMVSDKGWVAILIIFGLERALLYIGLVLHAIVPVISEELAVKLKRRKHLVSMEAKKAD